MKHVAIVLLFVATSTLVGCHQASGLLTRTGPPLAGTPPLENIQSVGDLQARFQADAGKPRLVLLVSPT